MTGKGGSPVICRAHGLTVRHGQVSTGGWNPYLKEALQTMFETGLPAIVLKNSLGRNTTQWMEPATCADQRKDCVKACE